MAKNSEVYKTAQERAEAFNKFCKEQKSCRVCRAFHDDDAERGCNFRWLDLEAEEEKPLPCIYCKGDMVYFRNANGSFLRCAYCNHQTRGFENFNTLVKEYNRVAKAAKESEANHAND